MEQIRAIGSTLAPSIARNPDAFTRVGNANRYQIIHAVDPNEKGKLDADILVLGSNALVDHVTNLRRIISAYLSAAYNYSRADADVIATFATVYNAVYRGNMEKFNSKYKKIVVDNLTKSRVGLSTNYQEWPGATQIVIPLFDVRGGISTVDSSEITDKDVIDSMRENENDMGIDSRKGMADLKDREADAAEEDAEEMQKKADEEAARAAEEAKKAEEANKEATDAKRDANDAQRESDDAQKKADEAQKAADEEQAKADDKQSEADEAQKAADEAKKIADNAQKIADNAKIAADEAQKAADEAKAAADDAQKSAQDAQKEADEAKKKAAANPNDATAQAEAARKATEAENAKRAADNAQKAAEDAQKAADEAKKTADNAQKIADDAKKSSENAQKVADDVQKAADEAQKAADEAKRKADEAKRAAEEARRAAEEARKNAENKQNAAEDATQDANEAQKAADDAQKAADDKQKEADDKRAEAQEEREQIAKDQEKVMDRENVDEANILFGLRSVDEIGTMSAIVKMNSKNGELIKESPVSVIRSRTVFEDGDNFIAIAGTNFGNGAIKLVLIDKGSLEIVGESEEVLSETSVLVAYDGAYYCVVKSEGARFTVGKFNNNAQLLTLSDVPVRAATPITISKKGVLVTSVSGKPILLDTKTLSAVTDGSDSDAK